jgi:hypothetical protein
MSKKLFQTLLITAILSPSVATACAKLGEECEWMEDCCNYNNPNRPVVCESKRYPPQRGDKTYCTRLL